MVIELLENNGGCQLPCWWGIIPGETTWPAARRFLATFASRFDGAMTPLGMEVGVTFPVPDEISPLPLQHGYSVYGGYEGVIQIIDVHIVNMPAYSLPQILGTYGEPDEIWIKTFRDTRENSLPFSVALFFSERGFIIDYSFDGRLQGTQVQGCYSEEVTALLSMWSTQLGMTFAEAVGRRSEFGTRPFFPLEEVTEIDVATFYQTFKEADNTICLETPADLWPWP